MGGVRPHYYCLPVLKREVHRQALVDAVTWEVTDFFWEPTVRPTPHT
jgi:dihydroorotase